MKQTSKGMIREDKSDKPIYFHYLPPHVLERYGVHMLEGAKKHGSGNFLKGGYGKENYLDSLYRHLLALKQGETNEDHASSIMFNIIGYMHEDWQENNDLKFSDLTSQDRADMFAIRESYSAIKE